MTDKLPHWTVVTWFATSAKSPPEQLLCRANCNGTGFHVIATLKNLDVARQIAADLNELEQLREHGEKKEQK